MSTFVLNYIIALNIKILIRTASLLSKILHGRTLKRVVRSKTKFFL